MHAQLGGVCLAAIFMLSLADGRAVVLGYPDVGCPEGDGFTPGILHGPGEVGCIKGTGSSIQYYSDFQGCAAGWYVDDSCGVLAGERSGVVGLGDGCVDDVSFKSYTLVCD